MAEGECKALGLLFRIAALGLSVAAAVVMGTASQLVIVDGSHGPEPSTYTVSYSQYNALRIFVAASAISAVCSAAALYLFAVRATAAIGKLPLVPLLDAATQGLLFSAVGAAFAVRDVVGAASGPWGSSGGGGSVCDGAGAFCGRVSIAAAVCAFAAVAAAVAALARDAGHSSSGGRRCDC